MSIASILKALSPFARTASSDLDQEIADINRKAQAAIADAKLRGAARATAAARQSLVDAWNTVKADYERRLAAGLPVGPSVAPSGLTGPTGAQS